ncbi:MAG: hypothetical protein HC801_05735 [Nitrospira sp.]|nr:hypothetical protein [Nitrospira sp.]
MPMQRYGKMHVRIGLGLVLCSVLGVGVVSAKVQVLPETTLLVEGKKLTGQKTPAWPSGCERAGRLVPTRRNGIAQGRYRCPHEILCADL